MVDEPGQDKKDAAQGTIFNSDIGDDWGEAFEAEDFLAAPKEEAGKDFFLPEEPTAGAVIAPETGTGHPPPTLAIDQGRVSLFTSLADRFRQASLPLRLALILLPMMGLALAVTLPRLRKSPHPVSKDLPKASDVHPPTDTPQKPHPPASPPQAHEPAPVAVAVGHEEGTPPAETKPDTLRKKWRFPALIVCAKTMSEQIPTIVTTDLTLILRLRPESIPPADRESFVRELLYQFYTNQPPDDLRRYALERGEMNRKLQAWIKKQWPELPLDSITVDHYQLL